MIKNKKSKLILAILLLSIGIGLFVYPRITDYIYKHKVTNLEKEYVKKILIKEDEETQDNSGLLALYELLKEKNNNLYETRQNEFLRDKNYEITDINLADYGIENKIFGFIEIPSIEIVLPIYLGASEANMRLGATHLTGTSYPIGGNNTNSVIAAHRGFYKTLMFRNIDKIKIGDKLYIKNFMDTLEYKAVSIDIIKPDELSKLTIKEGKDMVTIISCHPFPNNYQRYVVYFERV